MTRWPRWLWGYVGLAAFSLLTVVGGLAVGVRLGDRFAASVAENGRLATQLECYRELATLARAVNAPGNDVFASLDPIRERLRLADARRAFARALKGARAGLPRDSGLARDRDLLRDTWRSVERMVAEGGAVLARMADGDENGATFEMARMDRTLHAVLDRIDALSRNAHDVQISRLTGHRNAALGLRRHEGLVAGLVGVLVVGLAAYGMRLAREARRNEEREAELLATVSHELRTPLTSLLGFAELLLAREYASDRRREYLTIIHTEAARLRDLVNDFLDLQRLEGSDVPIPAVPVDLRPVLLETTHTFVTPSDRHTLRLRLPADLPLVSGSADGLRQVMANLLSNAIKYSPDGGVIEVGACPDREGVRVWVTDAGIGIPADALPRLFGKFFRVENHERRRIGGTGLGLALVKRLVERHGGRVGVDSRPGAGSTFWILLPVPAAHV